MSELNGNRAFRATTGRPMSCHEIEAWNEYYTILDKYNKTHNVKMYDRVSIHKHFPEINAAFEHCLAMRTFTLLKDGA